MMLSCSSASVGSPPCSKVPETDEAAGKEEAEEGANFDFLRVD